MEKIFLVLIFINLVLGDDVTSDYDCFQSYLKNSGFQYKTHAICKTLFDENLKKFHEKLEEEFIDHENKECVLKWHRDNRIDEIFLRSFAKNQNKLNESMRLSFDDLVLPSIRRLQEVPDFMCNLENIFNKVAENSRIIKSSLVGIPHEKQELDEKEKCLLRKFADKYISEDNENMINFRLNWTLMNCNQSVSRVTEDDSTINEIYLFDMTRKQIDDCIIDNKTVNNNNSGLLSDIFDSILLIFEHFEVNANQEKELKDIFIETNINATENALKCMSQMM